MSTLVKIKSDFKATIVGLYEAVETELGSNGNEYDCTKVSVSKTIYDIIAASYDDSMSFCMEWLCYGPKVNETLFGFSVCVEDGFLFKKSLTID